MGNEIIDRVLSNMKNRSGFENFLPIGITEELKQNLTLFNTSIISEDTVYQYMFTCYNGERFITLQYPVQHNQNKIDTDGLKAFSCICADTFGNKKCVDEIYNRFKESIVTVLLDNGTKVIRI